MEGVEPAAAAVRAIQSFRQEVANQMHRVIVGHDAIIDHMLTALLVRGHVLLEGVPGTAKTLMVKTLAHIVRSEFKRIQFTPDLMPSDIIGTNVFNLQSQAFELNKGPIFTDLLLADEINRAPAKTQSALLESMEERRVSIDGIDHFLSPVFTVFATQNPVEYVGTYPLPEAQLDRFLMRISLGYPAREKEEQILLSRRTSDPLLSLDAVCQAEEIIAFQDKVKEVKIEQSLNNYIISLVRATREEGEFIRGVSTRGALALSRAAQAMAFIKGRDYVTPDDIKELFIPVTSHRVYSEWERLEAYNKTVEILERILSKVQVPR